MPAFSLSRRQALLAVACVLGGRARRTRLVSAPGSTSSGHVTALPSAPLTPSTHAPRRSWSTSRARFAGRASTASRREPGSPTRSRAPAARLVAPTSRSSISPHRSRTASRCSSRAPEVQAAAASTRAASTVGDGAGRPQHRDGRAARRAAGRRARHRAEDRRLPPRARSVHVRRPARRDLGHRPDPDRQPPRARRAVIWTRAPAHTLAVALCLGLAAANVARIARGRARLLGRRRARGRRLRTRLPARLALRGAAARRPRLVVGERASRRARPQPAERRDRPGRTRRRRRDGATDRATATTSASRAASSASTASRSTSASSSSSRSVARLRREPSSRCSPSFGCRAARSTGSTSAPGCAATASTSCSQVDEWKQIGRRGGLGGFADRLRSAPRAARSHPVSRENGARSSKGSCSATTRR